MTLGFQNDAPAYLKKNPIESYSNIEKKFDEIFAFSRA